MTLFSFKLFSLLLLSILAILPLLSPGLQLGSFAVEPETYKTAMAVGGSGILLLLWLLSHNLNQATKIVKTDFYLPIVAFIAWNIISFFWLLDVEAGLLAIFQYSSMAIGFFLILDVCYQDEDNVKKIMKFLVVSGLLVAILGLLQYYFRDSSAIQTFSRQAVVPASSFGNKNMSSQFLVMVIPISFILLWRSHHLKNVILLTSASTVMFWFLTHTYTRGGWLAMFLEISLLLIFIGLDYYKNKTPNKPPLQTTNGRTLVSKNNKILIMAIGVIVYLMGINYSEKGWEINNKLGDGAASIVAGDGNGRLPAWSNTLNLIKDNWVIGVGSGNWEANYPPYYDSNIKDIIYNERVRLRRLHNSYLEIISNVGIVGMSFLLWLVFLTIRALSYILLKPDHPHRYTVLALSMGLVGFLIACLISFPLRVYLPGLLALVYIGIIAAIYTKTKHNEHRQTQQDNNKQSNKKNSQLEQKTYFLTSSVGFTKLLILPLFVFAILNVAVSYNWLWAGHYHQKAIEYLHAGLRKKSLEYSIKSVKHDPYRAKALGLLGDNLKSSNPNLSAVYLQKSMAYNPNNSLVILALVGNYYSQAIKYAKQGNSKSSNEAYKNHLDTLLHLIKIDKRNVRGYALLTRYYVQTKQIDKAKQSYQQVLKWQQYFKGRNNFGPYDNMVNAISALIKPHLKT